MREDTHWEGGNWKVLPKYKRSDYLFCKFCGYKTLKWYTKKGKDGKPQKVNGHRRLYNHVRFSHWELI